MSASPAGTALPPGDAQRLRRRNRETLLLLLVLLTSAAVLVVLLGLLGNPFTGAAGGCGGG